MYHVYKLTGTDFYYFGKTDNIKKKRFARHKSCQHNKKLKEFLALGYEFAIRSLESFATKKEALAAERELIKQCREDQNCLNIMGTAEYSAIRSKVEASRSPAKIAAKKSEAATKKSVIVTKIATGEEFFFESILAAARSLRINKGSVANGRPKHNTARFAQC
jgi:predicted GIY-YIG superfamily endonuclease